MRHQVNIVNVIRGPETPVMQTQVVNSDSILRSFYSFIFTIEYAYLFIFTFNFGIDSSIIKRNICK